MSETCPWCGGEFAPAQDGVTHAYMLSSPGCWAAYGELLAREYSDAVLFGSSHRLTVDSYALQHPGDPGDRRAVQSFWIHGASLWLVLRMGASVTEATAALKFLAGRGLPPAPEARTHFAFTHADVLAQSVDRHQSLVRLWADTTLDALDSLHGEFERLALSAKN